ncbi:uroporphyrinogen-III C-methyltransferase [Nesterenkonia alba]|uniref:uroporphyrinogen-III C-methyltransferase n=1 Tax=Nesterenkonia alba TaxID=515814 RepID=UPI0003B5F7E5|nr:uroporphyrinogen-III C-methyltransferase [Nesterenkonia alba]
MENSEHSATGQVILVGGGPGAADLMTVRAMESLGQADVVFYDRLAPTDRLKEWAPRAQLFDVGKRPGHHRVTQENIHAMMISAAQEGKTVVRLKGGDPFVFGRGCEEVAACREAGVPVTVVPGITSAVAVPAAAGIPVTARNVSKAFTVISGHDPLSEEELAGLAGIGGTVVILMGVSTLGHTVAGLQRHGLPAETPAAAVEKGFTEDQRVLLAPLGELLGTAATQKLRSPAVLVIGEVVALAAAEEAHGQAASSQTAERLRTALDAAAI